ncbi:MAG: PQQ-binding-like beta-propeller repeat protein [Mariniblastus sp.]|nr:PQQ-binding-like beta-propeller repeat protein [Mariniblastus sp.]
MKMFFDCSSCLVLVSFLFSSMATQMVCAQEDVRTWTNSSGEFSVEAVFLNSGDGKVQLRRVDNDKVITLEITQLSRKDRSLIRRLMRKPIEKKKPQPPVAEASDPQSSAAWPHWRGPGRDGVSSETGLLKDWADGSPPLLWSAKGMGQGFSSVSVANDRIYTMGKKGGQTQLICASLQDGSLIWSTPAGSGSKPNCTPTVDAVANLVFGLTFDGDLLCVKADTGKEVWRKNFSRDFGGKMMSQWGYSESPLIDGERLICTPGGDQVVMVALDKRTGKKIWSTPMPGSGGAGYATPAISEGGGTRQYITLVGKGLISIKASDGKPLWHYPRIANKTANVPTSIVRDNYVFCSTGYGDGGSALLELKRDGQGVQYREVYYRKSAELQNHHGGMVMLGDHIYMGHGHNKGFPVCFNWKTGQPTWGPLRGPGKNSAAIVAADGGIYFRYQDGTMALIEANSREYKSKGEFRIATVNGNSWSHPVIVDKKLILRDQDDLHCYDLESK